jgi:DNA-binding MarR family transcriptional regulator
MNIQRPAPVEDVATLPTSGTPTGRRLTFQVHQLSAKIAQVANPLFRIHHLDQVSSRILVLLLERGEMHVGQLVEEMVLPQSTISHQLQRLEKRNLLRRRRAHRDNRLVAVTLTRKGAAIARQCDQLSLAVHRHIIQDLSEAESARLTALIAKAFSALEAFHPRPDFAKASADR